MHSEQPEPRTNIGFVCPEHAAKPNPLFARFPAESYVGHYVKRAFPVLQGQATAEHMWVRVQRVLTDGRLEGVLDNDPVYDCGLVSGDTVQVRLDEIEALED